MSNLIFMNGPTWRQRHRGREEPESKRAVRERKNLEEADKSADVTLGK